MKLMELREIEDKEHDKIIKQADDSMKKYEKSFKDLQKTMKDIKPHARIYLANEMIARIISFTELPPFVVTSILDGLKHVFQVMPVQLIKKETIEDQTMSYIG